MKAIRNISGFLYEALLEYMECNVAPKMDVKENLYSHHILQTTKRRQV
jgi:hypothetical protein